VKLWVNERLAVAWIGPGGPPHLWAIDVPAGTAVLPGDPVAPDLTFMPQPDSPERLARAKEIQLGRINSRRDRAIDAGFAWGGYTWDCDQRSQMAITLRAVMILAGEAWPSGFTWRTAANEDVALTAVQFRALLTALVDYVSACYANARTLKERAKAAQTVAAVIAIDVAEGWP
jgi:hypothetical protein